MFQTQREFNRLSRGSGYRIHALTGATASANSFGPQSSLRFGMSCICTCIYEVTLSIYIVNA